ncbi:MAG: hypothetical protein AAB676_21585 [Verrucomicrobiota bacterium]
MNGLRGEVGALRPQTNELAQLRAENRQLRSVTDEPDAPAEDEFKQETERRETHLKPWVPLTAVITLRRAWAAPSSPR